jgi:hypothetical protein
MPRFLSVQHVEHSLVHPIVQCKRSIVAHPPLTLASRSQKKGNSVLLSSPWPRSTARNLSSHRSSRIPSQNNPTPPLSLTQAHTSPLRTNDPLARLLAQLRPSFPQPLGVTLPTPCDGSASLFILFAVLRPREGGHVRAVHRGYFDAARPSRCCAARERRRHKQET